MVAPARAGLSRINGAKQRVFSPPIAGCAGPGARRCEAA